LRGLGEGYVVLSIETSLHHAVFSTFHHRLYLLVGVLRKRWLFSTTKEAFLLVWLLRV
jgi:hypothetical protein